MTCAIAQAQKDKRVAVIAAGQSNLHFHSGSFDLLGYHQGQPVSDPVAAIAALPESHPYHRLGSSWQCKHVSYLLRLVCVRRATLITIISVSHQ